MKQLPQFLTSLLLVSVFSYSSFAVENPWNARYASPSNEASIEADRTLADKEADTSRKMDYRVSFEEVEQAIEELLAQQGAGDSVKATIVKRRGSNVIEHHSPLELEVGNLFFDAQTQKWDAILYPRSLERSLAPIAIEGRYREIINIPVLSRRLRHGDVIEDHHIEMVAVPSNRLREGTALSRDEIVGKSPKRAISENRPIRLSEIVSPPVINDGDNVTMQYSTPTMVIKTTGRALNSGAEGDVIRVRNDDSHSVIQARIIAEGIVEAVPLGTLVASK